MSEMMIVLCVFIAVLIAWCIAITVYLSKHDDRLDDLNYYKNEWRDSRGAFQKHIWRAEEAFAVLGLNWEMKKEGWKKVEAPDAKA